ncbi:MAG TPA: ABC transporter ATP-binding protein [Iamia sp.]|jgi:oligopeptide/dipeptide ABC transporter ATP-binding protein|nr:ABC transporter ATP-binding protein [Iamia sp.]
MSTYPAPTAAPGDLSEAPERLLEIQDLSVAFPSKAGPVYGTKGVTMNVAARERLGVVGESGSGKSVTALAALGLVQSPGRIMSGSVRWRGESMLDPRRAAKIRGKQISMVFQDPMVSLNPLMTVERQIGEVLRKRVGMNAPTARLRATELLDMVGIPAARERLKQYPYEFSGGMRQRVMIAIALAAEPDLLIADEPTTALDVTIQAQILDLMGGLSRELGVAVMMITHDLGVVAEFCDRVQVMYAGRVVERSPVKELYADPLHPYSAGLIASSPRVDVPDGALVSIDGDPPAHADAVPGCPFHLRCPEAVERCRTQEPPLVEVRPRRWTACWKRMGTEVAA